MLGVDLPVAVHFNTVSVIERAAPLLDIALTTRDKGKPDAVPMCGIPVHAADGHIKPFSGDMDDYARFVALVVDQHESRAVAGEGVERGQGGCVQFQ